MPQWHVDYDCRMFGCHNRILQSQNFTPQWHVYRHIGCAIIGLGNPTIGNTTCIPTNPTIGHPTVMRCRSTNLESVSSIHVGCPIIGFSNPTIGCPIIGLGNPTIGHPTCYTMNATLGHPTVIAMSGTDSGMRFVRPKNRCGIADDRTCQSYNRPRL
ncbi:hypothetical protein V9T40_002228 [Parthenolecanium corni]|uniref:Uncharacterized protein n=1 Tax=Parthenolecanium corni TaxID=536013 RepID=A0AAN9TGB8_9HEMI